MSLPKAGEFYKESRTAKVVRVLFTAQDVTGAIHHRVVVFFPVLEKFDEPSVLHLNKFMYTHPESGVPRFTKLSPGEVAKVLEELQKPQTPETTPNAVHP